MNHGVGQKRIYSPFWKRTSLSYDTCEMVLVYGIHFIRGKSQFNDRITFSCWLTTTAESLAAYYSARIFNQK